MNTNECEEKDTEKNEIKQSNSLEKAKKNRESNHYQPHNMYQQERLSWEGRAAAIIDVTEPCLRHANPCAPGFRAATPIGNAIDAANWIRPKTFHRARRLHRDHPWTNVIHRHPNEGGAIAVVFRADERREACDENKNKNRMKRGRSRQSKHGVWFENPIQP